MWFYAQHVLLFSSILPGIIYFVNCNQPPFILRGNIAAIKLNFNPDFRLILPGTKWCGPGDIATHEYEFGELIDLDQCCKEHDGCDKIISSGKTDFDLTNNSPFTKLHCDCDIKLLSCLRRIKGNNKPLASFVEVIYVQGNKMCFKKSKPAVCESKAIMRCKKYSFKDYGEESFHWFDLISLI